MRLKQVLEALHLDWLKSDLGEMLSGGAQNFSLQVFGIGAQYVFVSMVARGFGAEAMGIFAIALVLLRVSSMTSRLGLDSAMVRFVSVFWSRGDQVKVARFYTISLGLLVPSSLITSGALFLLSPIIAESLFHKPSLTPYFQVAACAVLPMGILHLNTEALRGAKRIKAYAFLQTVLPYGLATLIVFSLKPYSQNPLVPVVSYCMAILAAAVISHWRWRDLVNAQSVAYHPHDDTVEILRVSLPMLLASSSLLLMQWIDTSMLGIFRNESDVGIYNVAMLISALTGIPLAAINGIAAPKIAELHSSGEMRRLRLLAQQASKVSFLSSIPIIVAIVVAPESILSLFGSEFAAGAQPLLILTAAQFVSIAAGPVGLIMQMTGGHKAFQNIALSAAGLNMILNLMLIPHYGANGAAYASLAAVSVWKLAGLIYVRNRLGFWTSAYVP